jgi:hypothetical protein
MVCGACLVLCSYANHVVLYVHLIIRSRPPRTCLL